MMKIYKIHLLIFFLVAIFPASVLLLQQSEDLMIVQTDKKIIIDGILDEWSTVKEMPVNLFPDGKKLDPSPDLIVTARFTYDSKNFYAAIKEGKKGGRLLFLYFPKEKSVWEKLKIKGKNVPVSFFLKEKVACPLFSSLFSLDDHKCDVVILGSISCMA